MAYWQNGKLYHALLDAELVQTVAAVARWVGIDADDVVVISEYTGGGFGSKITGAHVHRRFRRCWRRRRTRR